MKSSRWDEKPKVEDPPVFQRLIQLCTAFIILDAFLSALAIFVLDVAGSHFRTDQSTEWLLLSSVLTGLISALAMIMLQSSFKGGRTVTQKDLATAWTLLLALCLSAIGFVIGIVGI